MIPGIGVLQEQGSEFLVRAHELPDVVLDFKTGMNHRPKMSCSDEYQKREQILDAFGAKSSPQRLPGAFGLRRLDKDQRGSGKDQVFNLAVRGGPIAGSFDGRKAFSDFVLFVYEAMSVSGGAGSAKSTGGSFVYSVR